MHLFIHQNALCQFWAELDLLCKLNLMLVANSSGVRVEEGEGQWCFLQAEPQWAYEWHIINHDWAEMMCEWAKSQTKPHNTEIMSPDNLHCTSHVVMELDNQYEKDWVEGEGETLSFEKIFWTESMYAILVILTERKIASFFPNARLCFSLITFQGQWPDRAERGGLVKDCVDARDWF